jgi:uncharacterized SAM-binding protein YcdF (DUF218 family)
MIRPAAVPPLAPPAPAEPGRLWVALADAVGLILVLDLALQLVPGHGSIGGIFFYLPPWVPVRRLWPGLFGVGIVLRSAVLIRLAVVVAMWNAVSYVSLLAGGQVRGWALPFSYVLALALTPALFVRRRAPVAALPAALLVLALAHILTFGHTDYRRQADAIVVFGARAYRDGTPSQALYDRTVTGIDLYHAGYAGTLVFSGGLSEPDVMRRLAVERGVPPSAIVLDRRGVNTAATLRFVRRRPGRYLAVSHSFHTARIKMLAERFGIRCYTVPAREPQRLTREPYYVARECAALAAYYFTIR